VLRAGSVWAWRRTPCTDFTPPDDWTLAYAIRGGGALAWDADWVVVVDGEYQVTIPSDATAELPEGRYEWVATLTDTDDNAWEVGSGILVVRPNLEAAAAGDRELHAEKMIAAIKAELERRLLPASAGGGAAAEGYQVDNHGIQKLGVAELRKQLGFYRAELRALRSRGRNTVGRPVKVGFG